MSNQIENLLPIQEAASRYGVPVSVLQSRIELGKIHGMTFHGALLVSESDVLAGLPKSERPEYKKYAHLKGVGIGINEAGRKYGVAGVTIMRWYRRGLIAQVGRQGAQKILIDEADAAYCAEVLHNNPGQGIWLFNSDGTPYIKANKQ
jgi:predicted site-specific integrase-resolvase